MNLENLKSAYEKPLRLSPVSAWVEHIPFAFVLVDLLRPRTFVELGTHMGDSYCAFCQAVDTLKIDTQCSAVDTWKGDAHAGIYGRVVLKELREYHNSRYGRFSRLLKMKFDAAAPIFNEGSIDLLHIDGLHTYEAVRHDYELWLPKLSRRGVILFHDTQERKKDFGVFRLWGELAGKYPSFEFMHGHGLGILAVGADIPEEFAQFLKWSRQHAGETQSFFAALGNRIQAGRVRAKPPPRRSLRGTIKKWIQRWISRQSKQKISQEK